MVLYRTASVHPPPLRSSNGRRAPCPTSPTPSLTRHPHPRLLCGAAGSSLPREGTVTPPRSRCATPAALSTSLTPLKRSGFSRAPVCRSRESPHSTIYVSVPFVWDGHVVSFGCFCFWQ